MPRFPALTRYGCALGSVALAIALRRSLDLLVGHQVIYALPCLAVLATAWVGGLRPALVAVALGALGADWFLLPPRGTLALAPDQQAGLALFLVTGTGIALLGGSMERARERLEARVQERTTELEEANGALRASQALLSTVTDSGRVGLVVVTEEHRYRYANRAYIEILGLEGDIVGRRVADLLPSVYEAQIRPRLDLALGGQVVSYELMLPRRREGELPRFYAVSYEPGADRTGRFVVVVIVDISERKRAEEELRASEARLRLLIEGVSGHAIMMLDPGGKVLTWNENAAQIDGYEASEIVGNDYALLFPDEEQARGEPARELATAAAEGKAEINGWRVRKNGTRFWANGTLSALYGPDGQVRGYAKITRDVSETRRLEAQLRQSQKLGAFGQLAAGVAHDFNNLLSVILACNEMLGLSVQAGDEEGQQMLAGITEAGGRAATLTRQLLAFTRQQVLAPRVLEVNAVIEDVGKMLRRLIGEDIRLVTALAPALAPILVDPGQLEQVIMNLALNARDAMPEGGQLTIATGQVTIAAAQAAAHPGIVPGAFIQISLTDTGCGMASEVKMRIFEPFFTTKGVGKGTGLGLAVVHGIVRQSGGAIEVESTAGQGSSFRVYLPVTDGAATAAPEKRQQTSIRGHETILLVEDEATLREIIARSLEEYGYAVIKAPSPREALGALEAPGRRGQVIDLLLTDVVMPDLSGRQLAEALRLQRPELRVLFISGYTDDAVIRYDVRQAEVAFLAKPFTPIALAGKVREVLDAPRP